MTTTEIISRYNNAFQFHEPDLLDDVIAEDCVVENVDGTRQEGKGVALTWWRALAADPQVVFDLGDVDVLGDRAIIRWRLGQTEGVNIMRVSGGRIVEGLGYVKAA